MVEASFEHEGDKGLLTLITHFGTKHEIECTKESGQIFRLGGSAVSEVTILEGLILDPKTGKFRAFLPTPPHDFFEGISILSPEGWATGANRHCWIHEYYNLDAEGNRPGWLACRNPLKEANHVFVNLDVIDGGENLIKRYRASPFFGDFKIIV